jgi:hypothetical protein
LYPPNFFLIAGFMLKSTAAIFLTSLVLGGTPVANTAECPANMLYVVESKLCLDSASQMAVDPSCCARLQAAATSPDGSAKTMNMPKQCPAAPISFVKQTGTCTSDHKAIDLECCDAIPR